MKQQNIARTKCDRSGCTAQEDVVQGEKPKARWYEVTLGKKQKFDFCGACVTKAFGSQYADQFEIAKNARHLKKPVIEDAAKDKPMFNMMKHMDERMGEVAPKKFLETPMELNSGGYSG